MTSAEGPSSVELVLVSRQNLADGVLLLLRVVTRRLDADLRAALEAAVELVAVARPEVLEVGLGVEPKDGALGPAEAVARQRGVIPQRLLAGVALLVLDLGLEDPSQHRVAGRLAEHVVHALDDAVVDTRRQDLELGLVGDVAQVERLGQTAVIVVVILDFVLEVVVLLLVVVLGLGGLAALRRRSLTGRPARSGLGGCVASLLSVGGRGRGCCCAAGCH